MRVPEELELDSGVKVTIKPVPPRLYGALVANHERRRHRPEPPLREVKYKGEEAVMEPDHDDPVYQERLARWQRDLDARLQEYFMENAVQVEVPDAWRGANLREAGMKVPRHRWRLEKWLGLRKRADKVRARLYLEYVGQQTLEDVRRLNRAILSAAGLYTEDMVGEAEDRFRPDSGRDAADAMGDEGQRGPRIINLHRTASGPSVPLQPDGVGEPVGGGESDSGGVLPHESQT